MTGQSASEQNASKPLAPLAGLTGWWTSSFERLRTSVTPEAPGVAAEVNEPGPSIADLIDYRQFRRIGIQTSLASAVIRLGVFFVLAIQGRSPITVRYFMDILPYPAVLIGSAGFARLVSMSTLAAAIVMLIVMVVVSFRHVRRNQIVVGRFMGVIGCAEMMIVDVLRHVLHPPTIVVSTAIWTLWPISLGVVVFVLAGRNKAESVKATESACQDRVQTGPEA